MLSDSLDCSTSVKTQKPIHALEFERHTHTTTTNITLHHSCERHSGVECGLKMPSRSRPRLRELTEQAEFVLAAYMCIHEGTRLHVGEGNIRCSKLVFSFSSIRREKIQEQSARKNLSFKKERKIKHNSFQDINTYPTVFRRCSMQRSFAVLTLELQQRRKLLSQR